MNKKNISKKNNTEEFEYTPTSLEYLIDKLVMKEMLNAKDFDVLLKTAQQEFERTFCITDTEEEKEIE